jgi:hypothetical protein
MAGIVWNERARQDLKDIVDSISRDSKAYAQSFALNLRRRSNGWNPFLNPVLSFQRIEVA